MSSASAAGKVILLGEHAVVYGVPGIAAGIERGARATAELLPQGPSTLALGGKTFTADDATDLGRAFGAVLSAAPALDRPLAVTAEADLPPGGGLGCSAALAVAIARAAALATGREIDDVSVIERALAWERVFHGNPSGIDTAAAAIGTCLRFERTAGAAPLASPVDLWLAVGYSGSSASTKEMVEGIARLKDKRPEHVGRFLEAVRSLVDNAVLAIEAGDAFALGRFLDMNQMLLAGVMLSTEPIEAMCTLARRAGSLGVKLTGSGGGGSVIALGGAAQPDESGSEAEATASRIRDAWQEQGYSAFTTRIAHAKHPTHAHAGHAPAR